MEETIQYLLIPTVCEDMRLPGDQRGQDQGFPGTRGSACLQSMKEGVITDPRPHPQALTQRWVLDAAGRELWLPALDCPVLCLRHFLFSFHPNPRLQGLACACLCLPPPRTGHLEAGADSLQPPRRKPPPTPTLFLCSSLVGEVCALSEESGQRGCGCSCSGLLGPECTERVPSQGGGPHPSCSSTLCSLTCPGGLSDRAPSLARKPHLTDRTLCCKLEYPMPVGLSRKVASS